MHFDEQVKKEEHTGDDECPNVCLTVKKIDVIRWAESQKIKRKNKTILLILVSFWRDGFCRPSHAQIAERAGCSVDTVERAVKALHRMGVKRTYRYGKTGKRISNEYRFPLRINLSEERISDDKPAVISHKKRPFTNPQNTGESNPHFAGSILPLSEGKTLSNGKKHYWNRYNLEGNVGRWIFPPFSGGGVTLEETLDGLPYAGRVPQ